MLGTPRQAHLAISRSQLPKVLSGTTTATGPVVRLSCRAICKGAGRGRVEGGSGGRCEGAEREQWQEMREGGVGRGGGREAGDAGPGQACPASGQGTGVQRGMLYQKCRPWGPRLQRHRWLTPWPEGQAPRRLTCKNTAVWMVLPSPICSTRGSRAGGMQQWSGAGKGPWTAAKDAQRCGLSASKAATGLPAGRPAAQRAPPGSTRASKQAQRPPHLPV